MNPDDFTCIDLFAGIGGIRLAFESVGGRCVFSSEWDASAQEVYTANFGERPHGDITQIPDHDIPDHDILLGGFPCQPFSIIGDKQGFADTRGTLFFDIERILQAKRPAAFLLENVKQLRSHDKGRTFAVIQQRLRQLGYHVHWKILNALDFGLPQKRERIFIVGFRDDVDFEFPARSDTSPKSLVDILEPDDAVDENLFASDYIRQKRWDAVQGKDVFYPSIWHENKSGNVSVLPFSCALRAGASFSYLLVNGKRRLSPREQLRLQGFPDCYQIFGSELQIRKMLGNSVSVPVVSAVARQMIRAIRQSTSDPISVETAP
jgi:DNA (cytosine-5)-methyltransferase 1